MFFGRSGGDSALCMRGACAVLAGFWRCGLRAMLFAVAMALAFIQLMGPAAASDGCTALNTAALDTIGYYEILKNRFQAGCVPQRGVTSSA